MARKIVANLSPVVMARVSGRQMPRLIIDAAFRGQVTSILWHGCPSGARVTLTSVSSSGNSDRQVPTGNDEQVSQNRR
jgi:hypothetical protein